MRFINTVYERLRKSPKRVVFPEGTEPRIQKAAARFVKLGLGTPVLLGNADAIHRVAKQEGVDLEFIGMIDPLRAEDMPLFCERLEKLKRYRDLGPSMASAILAKPNYFASMMVQYGHADAIVTGADEEASSTLRPMLQLISPLPHLKSVSSCMALDLSNKRYGERGVMFFADCAVIPEPTVDQLADIAVETGITCRNLTGMKPRIAMLSFTTHSNGRLPGPAKVAAATALARQRAAQRGIEMEIDGEMQADTAILPELAVKKPRCWPRECDDFSRSRQQQYRRQTCAIPRRRRNLRATAHRAFPALRGPFTRRHRRSHSGGCSNCRASINREPQSRHLINVHEHRYSENIRSGYLAKRR